MKHYSASIKYIYISFKCLRSILYLDTVIYSTKTWSSLKIFLLSLSFNNFYHSVSGYRFAFIILVISWASWTCRLMYVPKFGRFLAIIWVSPHFSLSSLSGSPIVCMLVCFRVAYISLKHCLFFFIHLSFFSSDYIISVNLSWSSLVLSSAS